MTFGLVVDADRAALEAPEVVFEDVAFTLSPDSLSVDNSPTFARRPVLVVGDHESPS